MPNLKFDVDVDGIALITWDMPGRSMNVIDASVTEELAQLVDKVANDAAIKGAVVTSGKDSFCGGADLTMLERMSATYTDLVKREGAEAANKMVFEESRKLSLIYRQLEKSGKPWVAAINGTAMGGGFELCLACHHRVASDNPKTRLGLPEVKVGLFPGAGGTQRIARMLPPADALQFLLKGDQLKTDRAKALKLIDAVVPAADLVKSAKDWIKAGGKAEAPWDVKGFKLPGGPVYSKAGMMVFPPANAIYRRETYDNYPAARAILQVVYEGLQLDMDTALRVESRWFAKILRSPEAAAMIRSLFVSMQELNKGARRPTDVPATNLKKIGASKRGGRLGRGADRPRPGNRRQRQSRGAQDAHRPRQQRPHEERRARRAVGENRDHRRLRRAEGLRPGGRGGVRGPQGEIRRHRENPGGDRPRHGARLQHLDPAHHLARR
jgi:3-hydroxyacyl-CoA dehydrogenase / enoyl-CoA hydratase / 3-hydroxybutyryl-CoA epimerase